MSASGSGASSAGSACFAGSGRSARGGASVAVNVGLGRGFAGRAATATGAAAGGATRATGSDFGRHSRTSSRAILLRGSRRVISATSVFTSAQRPAVRALSAADMCSATSSVRASS